MSVITKVVPPGAPPKGRPITNHSYPRTPNKQGISSINSGLPDAKKALRPRYSSIPEFEEDFRDCSPEEEVTTWDIIDAFKVMALHGKVRPFFCTSWRGGIFINKCALFGTSTTPAWFGHLIDFTLDYSSLVLGPIIKFRNVVDDVGAKRFNNTISREQALQPSLDLGWRIHPLDTKGTDFCRRFVLNGIEWDLDAQTKTITEVKRIKYLTYVNWFREKVDKKGREVTLADTQKLVGYLAYVTLTIRTRRTFMARPYKFRRSFNENERKTKEVIREVRACLKNWSKFLSQPSITASFAIPHDTCVLDLVSDASNLGLGIVVGKFARFYPLIIGWQELLEADIGVAEAWAAESLLEAAVAVGVKDCVVNLVGDNQGVVFAWEKGWSNSVLTNKCIYRMNELAVTNGLVVRMKWVRSEDNVADAVSRGEIPPPFSDFPSHIHL